MTTTTIRPHSSSRMLWQLLIGLALVVLAAAVLAGIVRSNTSTAKPSPTQPLTGTTSSGVAHKSADASVGQRTGAMALEHQYGARNVDAVSAAGPPATSPPIVRTGGNVSDSHFYGGQVERY